MGVRWWAGLKTGFVLGHCKNDEKGCADGDPRWRLLASCQVVAHVSERSLIGHVVLAGDILIFGFTVTHPKDR